MSDQEKQPEGERPSWTSHLSDEMRDRLNEDLIGKELRKTAAGMEKVTPEKLGIVAISVRWDECMDKLPDVDQTKAVALQVLHALCYGYAIAGSDPTIKHLMKLMADTSFLVCLDNMKGRASFPTLKKIGFSDPFSMIQIIPEDDRRITLLMKARKMAKDGGSA